MGIYMTGIDHNLADLDVRSIFSFTKKNTDLAFEEIKKIKGIEGCVLISTCNRMELYVSTRGGIEPDLPEFLCVQKQVDSADYRKFFVCRKAEEAVDHLFRLACGLESRILGEDQIITQVKDALAYARDHFMTDHVLEVLFRMAVTAAKKVKTDVALSGEDPSVIHHALRILEKEGLSFEGKKCMVIGNGAMGKLAATAVRERKADVTVTVRQYRSGVVEIPEGCSRIHYGERLDYLPECDLVISATSSPNYTLKEEELCVASLQKPLTLIDLAVPRDIDPSIGKKENITLYDIDYFKVDLESEQIKVNIRAAMEILEKQLEEFWDWYNGRDVIAQINRVKEACGEDLVLRLTPYFKNMEAEESAKARKEIAMAGERMMNKLLFELKGRVSEESFRECIDAFEALAETGEGSFKK